MQIKTLRRKLSFTCKNLFHRVCKSLSVAFFSFGMIPLLFFLSPKSQAAAHIVLLNKIHKNCFHLNTAEEIPSNPPEPKKLYWIEGEEKSGLAAFYVDPVGRPTLKIRHPKTSRRKIEIKKTFHFADEFRDFQIVGFFDNAFRGEIVLQNSEKNRFVIFSEIEEAFVYDSKRDAIEGFRFHTIQLINSRHLLIFTQGIEVIFEIGSSKGLTGSGVFGKVQKPIASPNGSHTLIPKLDESTRLAAPTHALVKSDSSQSSSAKEVAFPSDSLFQQVSDSGRFALARDKKGILNVIDFHEQRELFKFANSENAIAELMTNDELWVIAPNDELAIYNLRSARPHIPTHEIKIPFPNDTENDTAYSFHFDGQNRTVTYRRPGDPNITVQNLESPLISPVLIPLMNPRVPHKRLFKGNEDRFLVYGEGDVRADQYGSAYGSYIDLIDKKTGFVARTQFKTGVFFQAFLIASPSGKQLALAVGPRNIVLFDPSLGRILKEIPFSGLALQAVWNGESHQVRVLKANGLWESFQIDTPDSPAAVVQPIPNKRVNPHPNPKPQDEAPKSGQVVPFPKRP